MPPDVVADWTGLGLLATLFSSLFLAARWVFRDIRQELRDTRTELREEQQRCDVLEADMHALRTVLAKNGIDWPEAR